MEQGGRSSGENNNDRNNNQQRRMKMPENLAAAAVVAPPQPPPQKCPRCDSNNTKFCYYNNYSLTQPRYFCKTCRRYWTQGGTLRNVPVGGGCRKGKRTMKAGVVGVGGSSSSSSAGESSSRSSQPLPPPLNITNNLSAAFFLGNNPRTQTLSSMSPFYSSGGFLSSLAAMQSMSQSQGGVNQSLGVSSNQFGGTSNMALLQGLHLPTPPKVDHQNQQQIDQQPTQSGFYQMENREKSMESSFYPSDQTLFPPTRPLGSWTQRFINNGNNNNNNNIWTSPVSSSADGGATNSATVADSSLGHNQWPDLPGFGPSP